MTEKSTIEDKVILLFICALVAVLPVAHTTTLRAVLLLIPLALWGVKMARQRKVLIRRTPLDLPLLLFLVTIIISLFTSFNLSESLDELRGEFLTYTLLFYLVVNNVRTEAHSELVVKVLVASSLFMAVYGIGDYFSRESSILTLGSYRAGSLHQGYEAYAQYIVIAAPFAFLYLVRSARPWAKALAGAVIMLNAFALFLTHTRGAWIAFYAELIALLALGIFRRRALRAGLTAALVLAPVVLFMVLPEQTIWHGKKGITLDVTESKNTGNLRLAVWSSFLKEFREDPFTPAGYGKTAFKARFPGEEFHGFEQAHNTFVNTATQLGVQGLIALLVIIFVILKTCRTLMKTSTSDFSRLLGLTMFVVTIGFFIANQFAEFYIDDTAQLFWLLAGVTTSMYLRRGPGRPGQE